MKIKAFTFILLLTICSSCKYYNFTGGDTGDAKTFQVSFIQNNAPIIEPGLDRDFTIALQDLFTNQTNLQLVKSNGDLTYEGEIVEFRISPMTATANQRAAQNRLTMSVQIRFANSSKPDEDFDQRFSFFYDYGANQQLFEVKDEAFQILFERITQDIFNASLANW
jgi:hypothetical protein